MGNELYKQEEIKDKEPEDYKNEYIKYGILTKRGEEKSYDDSYLLIPKEPNKNDYSLFGVFDGHNSDYVANYLSKNIDNLYKKEISNINQENYKSKIEEIFKNCDKNLKE